MIFNPLTDDPEKTSGLMTECKLNYGRLLHGWIVYYNMKGRSSQQQRRMN
jgi:hypothetical protein